MWTAGPTLAHEALACVGYGALAFNSLPTSHFTQPASSTCANSCALLSPKVSHGSSCGAGWSFENSYEGGRIEEGLCPWLSLYYWLVTLFGVTERKGLQRNDRHPLYELGRNTIVLNAKMLPLSVSVCCVSAPCAIKHVCCMATCHHSCLYGRRTKWSQKVPGKYMYICISTKIQHIYTQ